MADGSIDLGPATIDTNHDGVNDTAAVATNSGGTIAFTDKDGDGQADIAVQVEASGHTTTFEHTGDTGDRGRHARPPLLPVGRTGFPCGVITSPTPSAQIDGRTTS
jgi:hypothetical protein